MKKKTWWIVLLVLVLIQFIRVDVGDQAINPENEITNIHHPPQEISDMLHRACYDCHSQETSFPWYSQIAPVSWWVRSHIKNGRRKLNFSRWGEYDQKKKEHKIEECIEMCEKGYMPLGSYVAMHSEAKLSEDEMNQLISWFKSLED